jgi:hypothetical protein
MGAVAFVHVCRVFVIVVAGIDPQATREGLFFTDLTSLLESLVSVCREPSLGATVALKPTKALAVPFEFVPRYPIASDSWIRIIV